MKTELFRVLRRSGSVNNRWSPLGLNRDDHSFSSDLKFTRERTTTVDERYSLRAGKKLECRNLASEITITFKLH